MRLGPKQHKKQQDPINLARALKNGKKTVYWKRGCGHHAKFGYTYLGPDNRPKNAEQAEQQKKENPLPRHGTKMEHALYLVRENWHVHKDLVITKILNECNMSLQGATTYYYKARKIAQAN